MTTTQTQTLEQEGREHFEHFVENGGRSKSRAEKIAALRRFDPKLDLDHKADAYVDAYFDGTARRVEEDIEALRTKAEKRFPGEGFSGKSSLYLRARLKYADELAANGGARKDGRDSTHSTLRADATSRFEPGWVERRDGADTRRDAAPKFVPAWAQPLEVSKTQGAQRTDASAGYVPAWAQPIEVHTE